MGNPYRGLAELVAASVRAGGSRETSRWQRDPAREGKGKIVATTGRRRGRVDTREGSGSGSRARVGAGVGRGPETGEEHALIRLVDNMQGGCWEITTGIKMPGFFPEMFAFFLT